MNGNILMLPKGSKGLAVREVGDQDLYVNLVRNHKGHQQRRLDRRDAMKRRARKEQEDRDQQMRDLATVSMLSVLGAVLAVGLAL